MNTPILVLHNEEKHGKMRGRWGLLPPFFSSDEESTSRAQNYHNAYTRGFEASVSFMFTHFPEDKIE